MMWGLRKDVILMEMTENDKKKEYLWGYRNSLRRQKMLEDEIRELRLNKMVPSMVQDGMPHGSGGGDLSGYAARLDELLRELESEVNAGIDLRREIVRKVEQLPNETERLLMRYRYIHGLKWEEIAVKMEYSWKQIHRIHAKALDNFNMT